MILFLFFVFLSMIVFNFSYTVKIFEYFPPVVFYLKITVFSARIPPKNSSLFHLYSAKNSILFRLYSA